MNTKTSPPTLTIQCVENGYIVRPLNLDFSGAYHAGGGGAAVFVEDAATKVAATLGDLERIVGEWARAAAAKDATPNGPLPPELAAAAYGGPLRTG